MELFFIRSLDDSNKLEQWVKEGHDVVKVATYQE